MYQKFLLFFIAIFAFNLPLTGQENKQDQLVQVLSSLVYHIGDLKNHLEEENQDRIKFSEQEVTALWDQAAHIIYDHPSSISETSEERQFYEAFEYYMKAQTHVLHHEIKDAKALLSRSFKSLSMLWKCTCDEFELPYQILRAQQLSSVLDNNSVISKNIKERMQPYVISFHHPMFAALDSIFTATRATQNRKTFEDAGFHIVCSRPRTFIRVASHPLLPGYLIKVNFDSELRKKLGKPSWEWLVQRCEGAEKIRSIIKSKKIKHFVVAQKWIYPLPENPSPPPASYYTRHLAILLVTDMHLASKAENLHAWSHKITKEHLDELYVIISRAKGSSYRPDNIWLTQSGQFAFIDTEYPQHSPDYSSIRSYLSPPMKKYWDRLVKRGGP